MMSNPETVDDWNTVLQMTPRPERVEVLATIDPDLPGYWQMVREWWMDAEFPSDRAEEWVSILAQGRACEMMTEEERAVLAALPERVTVYRGVSDLAETLDGLGDGLSWTLDRDKAAWFAARFAPDGVGVVLERDTISAVIVAYLDGRGEREVILIPESLA